MKIATSNVIIAAWSELSESAMSRAADDNWWLLGLGP